MFYLRDSTSDRLCESGPKVQAPGVITDSRRFDNSDSQIPIGRLDPVGPLRMLLSSLIDENGGLDDLT